jgi:N-methylhydantoinase A
MAAAVRVMTVERGIDPRELALLAFGGAGPLHAVAVAEELGIRRVVVPRASGVLSAVGLVVSERRSDAVESVLLAGEALTAEAVGSAVERLADRSRAALDTGGGEVRASYDLRYAGQAFELTIEAGPSPDPATLREAFERAHDERYGYADADAEVELVTVRVAVVLPGGEPGRQDAAARERVGGPAVIDLGEATLVVPGGWAGEADEAGTWVLERTR